MKIAAVTLFPPKRAGSAFYSFNLYGEIAKYCEVVILTDESTDRIKQMNVVKAWSRNSLLLPLKLFKQIYNTRSSVCHFQMEYRPFNDSAVVSSLDALLAIALARAVHVKVFTTLHGIIRPSTFQEEGIQLSNGIISKLLLTFFYRVLSLFSTKVIVHTEKMQETLWAEYNVNMRKIVVIPHGVQHAGSLPHRRRKNKLVEIFFHGFIRPKKGLECLLKAARAVIDSNNNVNLLIAGEAPFQEAEVGQFYISTLEKLIASLRLENHVKIQRGVLSEKELDEHIFDSDILVFPYTDQFLEASGAVARTMDYGVPILCTRTPRFLGDLENGKDCLMVAPNDERELANGIMNLIDDQELRQRISENLKLKAKKRYWDVLAKEYVKLYRQ